MNLNASNNGYDDKAIMVGKYKYNCILLNSISSKMYCLLTIKKNLSISLYFEIPSLEFKQNVKQSIYEKTCYILTFHH